MTEQTESPLTFPCRFPIKAMGRANGSLVAEVERMVRRHAPEVTAEDVRTTASSRGNYVSVTVTITARSREQLDAIYHELNAHELILMTL